MLLKKMITFLILFMLNVAVSGQVTNDSLFNELDRMKRENIAHKNIDNKIRQINDSLTKVEILQSCSTLPQNCGTIVTASVIMAKIINGPLYGDTILITETCKKNNYISGDFYYVKIMQAPSFSVHLCSGKIYNRNWNLELDKNKYLLFFGSLTKPSKWQIK